MRRLFVALLLLTGCAHRPGLLCVPEKVTKQESPERTIYFTRCEGPFWVIFHDPVEVGKKVRYMAFIEDNSRTAHGYLKGK